jgi:hypothetical protein
LRHFLKRIQSYYPTSAKIVLALLDHAAKSPTPLSQAELINVGKSTGTIEDDQVRELLHHLGMDHYLTKDTDGKYVFRSALLRRWWLLERGLHP